MATEEEIEDLELLIECSREMARQRNQPMNQRLPTPFEKSVEAAIGILIRQFQRKVEGR